MYMTNILFALTTGGRMNILGLLLLLLLLSRFYQMIRTCSTSQKPADVSAAGTRTPSSLSSAFEAG